MAEKKNSIFSRAVNGAKAVKNWWDDDSSLLPGRRQQIMEEVKEANRQNSEFREKVAQSTEQRNIDVIVQGEIAAEREHQQFVQNLRAAERQFNENATLKNVARDQMKNEKLLQKIAAERQAQRIDEINKTMIEEEFNFYKVAPLLRDGETLKKALDVAGCLENVEYKLNYDGATFVRLSDDACDNACCHFLQNMRLEEYIAKTKNAVPLILGYKNQTSFSVGCLIYDKQFGFILMKNDKYAQTWPTDAVYEIFNHGYLKDKLGFTKIALSKTFMKLPVPCALCINVEHGVETEEDVQMFRQMKEINPQAAQRCLKALNYFLLPSTGLK